MGKQKPFDEIESVRNLRDADLSGELAKLLSGEEPTKTEEQANKEVTPNQPLLVSPYVKEARKEVKPTETKKEFEKRFDKPEINIKNPDGTYSTHKMASREVDGKQIAFPTIVNKDGKLQELPIDEATQYALKTGEYKEFPTEAEAQQYAEGGYKIGTKLEDKNAAVMKDIEEVPVPQQISNPDPNQPSLKDITHEFFFQPLAPFKRDEPLISAYDEHPDLTILSGDIAKSEAKLNTLGEGLNALKDKMDLNNPEQINDFNTGLGTYKTEYDNYQNLIKQHNDKVGSIKQGEAGSLALAKSLEDAKNANNIWGIPNEFDRIIEHEKKIKENPYLMTRDEANQFYEQNANLIEGVVASTRRSLNTLPVLREVSNTLLYHLRPDTYRYVVADELRDKSKLDKVVNYINEYSSDLAGIFGLGGGIHQGINTLSAIESLAKTSPKIAKAISSFTAGSTYEGINQSLLLSEGKTSPQSAIAQTVASGLVWTVFSQVGTRDWTNLQSKITPTVVPEGMELRGFVPKWKTILNGQNVDVGYVKDKGYLAKSIENWLIDSGIVTATSMTTGKVVKAVNESDIKDIPLVESLQKEFSDVNLTELGIEYAINAIFTGTMPRNYGNMPPPPINRTTRIIEPKLLSTEEQKVDEIVRKSLLPPKPEVPVKPEIPPPEEPIVPAEVIPPPPPIVPVVAKTTEEVKKESEQRIAQKKDEEKFKQIKSEIEQAKVKAEKYKTIPQLIDEKQISGLADKFETKEFKDKAGEIYQDILAHNKKIREQNKLTPDGLAIKQFGKPLKELGKEAQKIILFKYNELAKAGKTTLGEVETITPKFLKEIQDASQIRKDQGKLPSEGVQLEEGKRDSGENIQQTEEARGPEPAPQITPETVNEPLEVHFTSGSSSISDLKAFVESGKPVGVIANKKYFSKNAQQEVIKHLDNGGKVFVDSGAFSGDVDFDAVIKIYEDLAEGIKPEHKNNLLLVAPDVVGDQSGSFKVLQKYIDAVRKLSKKAQIVVPFQKGGTPLSEYWKQVSKELGTEDFRIGIPSNKSALSGEDIRELLSKVPNAKIHFLGISPNNKARYEELSNIVKEFTKDITSDASFRSKISEISDKQQDILNEKELEGLTDEIGNYVTGNEIKILKKFGVYEEGMDEESVSDTINAIYDQIEDLVKRKIVGGISRTEAIKEVLGLEEKIKKPEPPVVKPSEKMPVKDMDVNEISIDTEKFQNRIEPFSQKTYDSIVNAVKEGKWNWGKFDAIKVWRNPEDNKLYTLNHSRLKAFQDLAKQGYKEFQTIPSVEFKGTLDEAIKFATEESNVLGAKESDLERANIYRKDREKKLSKKEILDKAKNLEGKNANYIINLSHLNPDGTTIAGLKAFEKSGSKQDTENLETIADWVGEARKRYDDLSDSHEDEIFTWLKEGAYKKIGNRTKFLDRIDNIVGNEFFDKTKSLNLENKPSKGYNQTEVESRINEVKGKLKDLESERDNKKSPPNENRLNEISEEIKLLNKDLGKLNEDLRKAKEADKQQGDIFGQDINLPEDKPEPPAEKPIEKPVEKPIKKPKEPPKPKGQFEGDKPDMPKSEGDLKKALDKIKAKKKPPGAGDIRVAQPGFEIMAVGDWLRINPHLDKETVDAYVDVGAYVYQNKEFRKKHLWAQELLNQTNNDSNLTTDFINYIWSEIQSKYADQIKVVEDFNEGGLEEFDSVDKKPIAVIINEKEIPKPKENFKTDDYGGILSDGQILGINLALDRVLNNKAFLLGDGTGFGKTMQMLVVANEFHKKTGKAVLILCPDTKIIKGFKRDSFLLGVDTEKFVMGTYGQMTNGKFKDKHWGLILCDEAHKMKNIDSQRSQAFWQLKTDVKLFASATPMDKISGANYFFSEITGKTEEEVARELGYAITYVEVPDPVTRKMVMKKTAHLLAGFTWEKVRDSIIKLRDQAIRDGALIRREYPFWGHIKYFHTNLPGVFFPEQAQINDYFDLRIAKAKTLMSKRNYAGQRIFNINKLSEAYKKDILIKRMLEDLEAGKSVAIMGELHGDVKVEGIPELVGTRVNKATGRSYEYPYKPLRGLLGQLAEELDKRGIKYAKIFEDVSDVKLGEAQKFVRGDVRVALFTPTSGGTGIDLDDQKGDKPRVVYFPNLNFAADVFEQALGRFNRKNTQSATEVRIVLSTGSRIDTRKYNILKDKMRIMRRIQSGEDPDRVTGFSEEYSDLGDVLDGNIEDPDDNADFEEVRTEEEIQSDYAPYDKAALNIFEPVKKIYATTDFDEATWIIPDGSLLKAPHRTEDIREFNNLTSSFLDLGAVRCAYLSYEIHQRPNSKTVDTIFEKMLRDLSYRKKSGQLAVTGIFHIDFKSAGLGVFASGQYDATGEGISAAISDIENFWDTGRVKGGVGKLNDFLKLQQPGFKVEKVEKQDARDLMALHNLSEGDLKKARALGALAAPSVAITNKNIPFDKYGEITLIGDKDLIDPRKTRRNKIYESDAWTSTHPRIYFHTNKSKLWDLYREFAAPFKDIVDYPINDWDNVTEGRRSLPEVVNDSYAPDTAIRTTLPYIYLQDNNKAFKLPLKNKPLNSLLSDSKKFKEFVQSEDFIFEDSYGGEMHKFISKNYLEWRKEHYAKYKEFTPEEQQMFIEDDGKHLVLEGGLLGFNSFIEIMRDASTIKKNRQILNDKKYLELIKQNFHDKVSKEDYYDWVKEKFGDLIGEPYIYVGKRKVSYNIDNVLAAMRKEMSPEKNSVFFGLGAAKAYSSKNFTSINDMKKIAGRLVTEQEMEEFQADQFKRFNKLSDDVYAYYKYQQAMFDRLDDLSKSVAQIVKFKAYDVAGATRILNRNSYENVPDYHVESVIEFARNMASSPSQYFEAKPLRAVNFNEFRAAVVPQNISKETIDFLQRQGIEVATYDPSVKGDRQKAIEGFANIYAFQPGFEIQFPDGGPTPLSVDLLSKFIADHNLNTYPKALLNNFIKQNQIKWDELNVLVNKKAEVSSQELQKFLQDTKQKALEDGLFGDTKTLETNRRIAEKRKRAEERELKVRNEIIKEKSHLNYLKNLEFSAAIYHAIQESQRKIAELENKVNNLFNQPDEQATLFDIQDRSDDEMTLKFGSTQLALDFGEKIDKALESAVVKDANGDIVNIPKRTVPKDWKVNRQINIVGRKIESYGDLADMFYVVRDPTVETQWFISLDGEGRIVGNIGFSSNCASIVNIDQTTFENAVITLKERGAKTIVPLHNHPSGSPEPSKADKQSLALMADEAKKFGVKINNSLVIDGDKYSNLYSEGFKNGKATVAVNFYSYGKPEKHPNQVWYDKIDKTKVPELTTFESLAQMFANIKRGENEVIVVAINANKIIGYESVPVSLYHNPPELEKYLDQMMRSHGAQTTVILGDIKHLAKGDYKTEFFTYGAEGEPGIVDEMRVAKERPTLTSDYATPLLTTVAYGDKEIFVLDNFSNVSIAKYATKVEARNTIPNNPTCVRDVLHPYLKMESPGFRLVGGPKIGYDEYSPKNNPNFKESDLNSVKRLSDISKELASGLEMNLGWHIRTTHIKKFSRKARGLFFPGSNIIRIETVEDFHALCHEMGHKLDLMIFKFSENMAFDGTKEGGEIVRANGIKDAKIRQRLLDNLRNKYGSAYVDSTLEKAELRKELYNFLSDEGYPIGAYAPSKLTKEGVAEFIRSYIQSPTTIKTKAPKFYQLFHDRLLAENKPVFDLFEKIKEEYKNFAEQDELLISDAGIMRTSGKNSFMNGLKKDWDTDKVFMSLIDAIAPLRELVRRTKEVDPNLTGDKNAEEQVLSLLGVQGKVNQFLHYKPFLRNGNQINFLNDVKPLMEILEPIIRKGTLRSYENYLLALSDIEEHENGMPQVASQSYIQAKRNKQKLEQLHGVDTLEKFSEEVQKYQRAVLDYYYQAGKLSEEAYQKSIELHKHYIPMKRYFEDFEMQSDNKPMKVSQYLKENSPSPVKRRYGSPRPIKPIFESILENTYDLIAAADRNYVLKALISNLQTLEPDGSYAQEIPSAQIKRATDTHGKTVWIWENKAPKGTIVQVWEGGKPHYYEIATELYAPLFEATKVLTDAQVKARYWMSLPTRILQAGAVVYDPTFSVRNISRDQVTAWLNSKYGFNPLWTLKGFSSAWKHDEYYQLFLASGADQSFLTAMDQILTKEYLESKHISTVGKRSAMYLHNPLRLLQDINRFSEIGTRLGAFRIALAKTGDVYKAAQEGREITADYAIKGKIMSNFVLLYPFLNPRIQHTKLLMQNIRHRPAHFFRIGSYLTAFSVLNWIVNNLDDDDREKYQNLANWKRLFGWNIHIPGTDLYLPPIPKGPMGVLFGTTIETFLDYMFKNKPNEVGELLSAYLQEFSPISNVFEIVPQWIRPPIEVVANKVGFTGRPIVNQNYSFFPEQMQAADYTTHTARMLSALVYKATGGGVAMSPIRVDYFMRAYLSGTYSYPTMMIDEIAEAIGVVEPNPEEKWTAWGIDFQRMPLIKQFLPYNITAQQTRSIDEFYKKIDQMEKDNKAVNDLFSKDYSKGDEMYSQVMSYLLEDKDRLSDYRWFIRNQTELDKYKTYLSVARNLKSEIRKDKTIKDPDEEINRINLLNFQTAIKFGKAYQSKEDFNVDKAIYEIIDANKDMKQSIKDAKEDLYKKLEIKKREKGGTVGRATDREENRTATGREETRE